MKKEWLEYCQKNNYKLMISEDKNDNLYDLFKNKKNPILIDLESDLIFNIIEQYSITEDIFYNIKYKGKVFISYYHYNAKDLINLLPVNDIDKEDCMDELYVDFLRYLEDIEIDNEKLKITYKNKNYANLTELLNKMDIEDIIYADMKGDLLFSELKIKDLLEVIKVTKTKEEIELSLKIMKRLIHF